MTMSPGRPSRVSPETRRMPCSGPVRRRAWTPVARRRTSQRAGSPVPTGGGSDGALGAVAVVEEEVSGIVAKAEVTAVFRDGLIVDLQVVDLLRGDGAVAVIGAWQVALARQLLQGGAAAAPFGDRLDLPADNAPGDEVADGAGHHRVVVLATRGLGLAD